MHCASISQLALAACCLIATGCTVCHNAMRTVWYEPAAYSWKHDRQRSLEAYRQLADEVCGETVGGCPELGGAIDYGIGFRDGFVDFVYAGGNGEPPPVPPRHFWNVMLRTPEGKARADQWFAGYRHGARVARDGGYRELGTVDSSLIAMHPAVSGPLPMRPQPASIPLDEQWPGGEVLPEPNSVSPVLSNPQTPFHELNESLRKNDATNNEAPLTPFRPINEPDAFMDDPNDEETAPAFEPLPANVAPVDIEAATSSSDETSVSRAVATVDENATSDVILISANPHDQAEVLQHAEEEIALSAHSTVRIVMDGTPSGEGPANRTRGDSADQAKFTLHHLRGRSSAELQRADASDNASMQHDWAAAKGTTIHVHHQDKTLEAAPAASFVPYGVTFDR